MSTPLDASPLGQAQLIADLNEMESQCEADDFGETDDMPAWTAWAADVARRASAALSSPCPQCAEKDREWERLAELLHTGGMSDPAFVIGVVEADMARAERAEAQCARLHEALRTAVEVAKEAHVAWDSDRDSRVGKLLMSLAGYRPSYRADIDAIHVALKAP